MSLGAQYICLQVRVEFQAGATEPPPERGGFGQPWVREPIGGFARRHFRPIGEFSHICELGSADLTPPDLRRVLLPVDLIIA